MTAPETRESQEVFKCRYCTWTCRKWSTNKSGRKVSGWRKLEDHLEDEHGVLVDLKGEGS